MLNVRRLGVILRPKDNMHAKFNAGMKQREIAAEMCCSQSKVHNLLKKARFLKLITVL